MGPDSRNLRKYKERGKQHETNFNDGNPQYFYCTILLV